MNGRCWKCGRDLLFGENLLLVCTRQFSNMDVHCEVHWDGVSDRGTMPVSVMSNLAELQTTMSSLVTLLTNLQPVMQTSTDLSQTVIGKLEELTAQIATLTPTQEAIDALQTAAAQALESVRADKDALVAVNQAYVAELGKLTPPAGVA